MKNNFLIFLMMGLMSFYVFGQDTKPETESKPDPEKKIYSQNEFEEKVQQELEKRLLRAGRKKIIEFSKELFKKEGVIEEKELSLTKREEQLKMNIEHFEKRVKEVVNQQEKVLGCVDNNSKAETDRVRHMVRIISNMKPNQSAQVLSVQDADITVKILGLLEPDKVSKIFNLMDKEISARLQKQYLTMKK